MSPDIVPRDDGFARRTMSVLRSVVSSHYFSRCVVRSYRRLVEALFVTERRVHKVTIFRLGIDMNFAGRNLVLNSVPSRIKADEV